MMSASSQLKNNKPTTYAEHMPGPQLLLPANISTAAVLPPTYLQNTHCVRLHLPKQHAKVTRSTASTHQPLPQYNAQPMLLLSRRALSERSHRTAPSIQRHLPPRWNPPTNAVNLTSPSTVSSAVTHVLLSLNHATHTGRTLNA